MATLTRLLLDSEDNDIRRARLRLAEKCTDYNATAAAIKEWPRMRAYLAVVGGDTSLSHDEKIKRVRAILFGWKQAEWAEAREDKHSNEN